GAEVEQGLARMLLDQLTREVSRGEYSIVGVGRNTEAGELNFDRSGRAWGIGQQQHDAAAFSELSAGFDGFGIGLHAIVHDAPDIAEPGVIPGCEWGDRGEELSVKVGSGHPAPIARDA